MKKILVAATGFSANGVSMAAGQPHDGQFDDQTVRVLVGMKRLVEVEADEADDAPAKKGGKTNRAVDLPGSDAGKPADLPTLPGA